jgi:hypothetical protein
MQNLYADLAGSAQRKAQLRHDTQRPVDLLLPNGIALA